MNYYKYIDIDDLDIIINKCLGYVKSIDKIYKREISSTNWYNLNIKELREVCPELVTSFLQYDLKIIMAAAYVMYRPEQIKIHKDASAWKARINLPLLNCKDTYTEFYESDTNQLKWINPEFGSFFVPKGDYKLVDRVEIKQATVIKTGALHSVYMPTDNPVPRITLTLGFHKDPVYMLE
jgi:hypothetical protein